MSHGLRKYGIPLIAALLLAVLAFSGAGAAAEVEAGTFDGLVNAIDAGNDVKLTDTITIEGEKTLDLKGHTVKAASDKRMFLIKEGANFTLKDSQGSGKLTGSDLSGGDGGCVYVEKGAAFTMEGGVISNCKASYGGGVYVRGGMFKMVGGSIDSCEAYTNGGGVSLYSMSDFIMDCGTISHCHGLNGGGVEISNDCKFVMGKDATISNCYTSGGVISTEHGGALLNSGTVEINGGTISECTTTDRGGGIASTGGRVTMNDGRIYKCKSTTDYGGGVYLDGGAKFVMKAGVIEECEAEDYGGGVYLYSDDGTDFTMDGGTIKNCKIISTWGQQDEGGGVYLEGGGSTFSMNDGLITGCYAEDYGGGVMVDDDAKFYMNGGVITNCRVDDDYGGGVWVDSDAELYPSGFATVYNNYKGDAQNNVGVASVSDEKHGRIDVFSPFYGFMGVNHRSDGQRIGFTHIPHSQWGNNFIKDDTGHRSEVVPSPQEWRQGVYHIKLGGPAVPEFKDMAADTVGPVKATQPLTDSSKIYKVDNPITLMNPLVVAGGTSEQPVTININSKATIYGTNLYKEPAITVNEGCHLKLTGGGVIHHGIGENGGVILLKKGSSLTIDNIRISGGRSTNGGGIYADEDTVVTIHDGTIEHCRATEYGGGIYSKGLLVMMDGGNISVNTAGKNGSGMYVSDDTMFNVGNTAQVIENKKGDKDDNVYLESDRKLLLSSSLLTNSKVGISYAGGIADAGKQFGLASSAMSTGAEHFKADGTSLVGKISGNILLWSIPQTPIMVTFHANGGTVSPSSKTVYEDEPYGELPTPKKDGHIFAGWFDNDECAGTEITSSTIVPAGLGSTQTLYAKWRGPIVTVTFDAGEEGTVFPSSKKVVYNEHYGELPIPVRKDYSFNGWYLEDRTTKITKDTPVTKTEPHTLYASWSHNPVTVTLNANGGTVDPASKSVYPGKPYGTLPIPVPTDDDYTFVGWYLTPDFSSAKITKDTIVKETADHTLYAKWFGPIIVSNTNIDFGTVFKDDAIKSMKDMVYTELPETVNLTFPSGDFIFRHGGNELSGEVSLLRGEQYDFSITPKTAATEGFYSAAIPITNSTTKDPLGNLSVTMSVVAKDLKNDKKASVPDLPPVYNLIDAANSSHVAWLVGVDDASYLHVDAGTATISYGSKNAADNSYLQITSVTSKPAGIETAIMLTEQSEITAHYPSKNLENKNRNYAGTYSVELGLTDVLRNLPTFIGTFNETLTRLITAIGYTPVTMFSPVNGKDALATMNPLVKDHGVEVTFTVPVKQLPKSIILAEAVSVFSVDADGNVLVVPASASQVGDDYVVTAHGSSLSSYVLAFDKGWEYYGITPLEGWHGDIDPDYLYHKAGDTVSVTPVPDVDYEYRALLVYNESWSLYTVTTGTTFRMPKEHVYLYGVFAGEAPTTCTVRFDMNGHGDQIDSQTVNIGEKAKKPADPTASGYAFVGWFSDIALLIPYDFDTPVTDDIELHAKWTEASANRGHSASIPKDYTPSSSVPVMEQSTQTAAPTPTPAAPTAMPTTKPTTQQTQKSPAPFVGLIAGLGVAALVLARMRR